MTETTVAIPTRVLVQGMVQEDGTIDAAELYAVADACGQSADQVRSCLRRLVADGSFVREGSGRYANYRATAEGLAALGETLERTRLAYVQDAAGRGWDRHWHLVGFAVPENRRAGRDAFRDRLLLLGGAAVQSGLYVSPHPWHKDVRAAADQFDIADSVLYATTDDLVMGDQRDPRELARRLWPVDELARRYQGFIEDYDWVPLRLTGMKERRERLPDAAFLPMAFGMGVAFAEVFNLDPLLPPELLPRPWPGRAARDLVVRSRRLALSLRQTAGRPALFRQFDDVMEAIR